MTFALAFAGCLVFEMPFVALERAVFSTAGIYRADGVDGPQEMERS